jgi:hypothetical protein
MQFPMATVKKNALYNIDFMWSGDFQIFFQLYQLGDFLTFFSKHSAHTPFINNRQFISIKIVNTQLILILYVSKYHTTMRYVSKIIIYHYYPIRSANIYTYFQG